MKNKFQSPESREMPHFNCTKIIQIPILDTLIVDCYDVMKLSGRFSIQQIDSWKSARTISNTYRKESVLHNVPRNRPIW
jgi:hypothetical protein